MKSMRYMVLAEITSCGGRHPCSRRHFVTEEGMRERDTEAEEGDGGRDTEE